MVYAYKNDVLVSNEGLSVSLADYGFCRGYALFELTRCYGAHPFRLQEHLSRLQNGMKTLGLNIPQTAEKFTEQTRDLLARNNFTHSIAKIYVTAGVPGHEEFSFARTTFPEPQVYLINAPLSPTCEKHFYSERVYNEGLKLVTMEQGRVLPGVKTINYAGAICAAKKAGEAFDDILYIGRRGQVTEASRANFFWLKNGEAHTTPSEMLPGITRLVMGEVLNRLGIPLHEHDFTPQDVYGAQAAFLSSSILEVAPVGSVDDHALTGDISQVHRILAEFKQLVEQETAAARAA